jgi:undecaprenyl-diphosphatase
LGYFEALVLGIVQGLTEFLPVSSSGHLVILQRLLGIAQHDLAFDLAAHVGTVISIFTIYYALLARTVRSSLDFRQWHPALRSPQIHLVKMVIAGSIPTAIVGLAFKKQFEAMFSDMTSLGVCFIITGLILVLSKIKGGARFAREDLLSLKGVELITYRKALLIGLAQGLAIAPSISRSGITIIAGLLLGIPGPTAAMYSFILSLPAILGAAVLELKDVPFVAARWEILLTGLVTAYVFGLIGLWGTLASVKRGRLEIFSGYLVALGVFILWAWV